LDPLIEHILDLVGSKQDLAGMQRSLSNSYSLYLKTRPSASSESVRRAKQLQPEGCHPLLLAAVKHKTGGQVDMQVSAVFMSGPGNPEVFSRMYLSMLEHCAYTWWLT
jgi:hypothetical protein